MKGCNMSFHKADIVSINGFDEDYALPAVGEDIDLIWRFQAAGFTFRSEKNFCVQYHLHHQGKLERQFGKQQYHDGKDKEG